MFIKTAQSVAFYLQDSDTTKFLRFYEEAKLQK